MNRRDLITVFGGIAVAWPFRARAQQSNRMRRIGVLMGWDENDPEAQFNLAAFVQGLQQLGWVDGRKLRIDYRWANGDINRMRMFAKELVDLQPDVILANTTPVTAALQQETRMIPIVFVIVSDPVGVVSLRACLSRAGISPASSTQKGKLLASCWSCSRRSRQACQTGRHHVQPRHGARRRIILSTLIRGHCPIVQNGADRSARS